MYKYIDVASTRLGYKTIHFLFGVQVVFFFFFFLLSWYIYGFNCNTIIDFIFCCCFYSLYYEWDLNLGTQRLEVTSQTLRTARHTPPKKKNNL